MKKGSRFIALACAFILMLSMSSMMMSCATTGGGVAPTKTEDFLAQHEILLKLGTEAAVLAGLRANPTYEATVVKVAGMLDKATFPADGVGTMKDFVMKSVDLSKFSVTEQLFIGLVVDEFVSQVEVERTKYCETHSISPLCVDQGTWMKTAQVYLHKFAGWLRTGVELTHQSTVAPRSAFPVLEPVH